VSEEGATNSVAQQKEELFSQKQQLSSLIVSKIGLIKEKKIKRDELTLAVKLLKDQRTVLNNKLKELFTKLRSLTPTTQAPSVSSSHSGQKPGQKVNASFLKKQIDTLKYKVETDGMDFEAEKKMMKKIKELQKELSSIQVVQTARGEFKELSLQIDAVKKESDEIHKQIQEKATASQVEHESILTLSKEIDELRSQEKDVLNKAQAAKSAYKEQQAKQSMVHAAKAATEVAKKQEEKKVQKEVLVQKAAQVEEKIKQKKKLTTEDLLVFQADTK
jgi:uncharacterized coiled-coil DUF342 family protein